MHNFQKIFAESPNAQLHINNSSKRGNLMPNNVPRDLIELNNYLIKVNIEKSREFLIELRYPKIRGL